MNPLDFYIHPVLEEASTLPSSCYRDPHFFRAEKEKIFGQTWQWVARTDQVAKPGDYLATQVGDEPIVIVRGKDNTLRAFSNVCRHRGSPIMEGEGNAKVLQCPYHAWTYQLSGELSGTPEFEGVRNFDRSKVCLPQWKIDTWGPSLFVNLRSNSLLLSEILGNIPNDIAREQYPIDEYRFLTRIDYTVRCNWKIYVDNYLEGYHLPTVHPALFRELDYKEYRVDTFRYYSSQYAPLRPLSSNTGEPRRYDPATETRKPLYYWVFPNYMINFYPDNLQINRVVPVSIDETLVTFEWYVPPGNPAPLQQTIAFSEQVQKEDGTICENVQRGLASSTYREGRYCAKRENGVHHFHLLLQEFLQGKKEDAH